MSQEHPFIRLGARLVSLRSPLVMAIVNATPDSFFPPSRAVDRSSLREAYLRACSEGADILDIGACSTRPAVQAGQHVPADAQQEWQRLDTALSLARDMGVRLPISVDTFRPEVAQRAIEVYGVDMINDVSGGSPAMFDLVADSRVAYVLTYNRRYDAHASDDLLRDAMDYLSRRVDMLHRRGVSDVIIDPGFGFEQTVQQSLDLLSNLHALQHIGCPILVGISRKRMAYEPEGLTARTSLPQTLRLERQAMQQGADILRVHDVAATRQMINDK
ncbi:MAG: dihydropteroate synthase [Paludibacteraceae bacterium]|nr:dihydropteroate synthase [Paludibacteraceae bacterium]